MSHRPLSHWFLLGLLVLIWGTAFAVTKVAVATIAPVWVVALRLWVAALMLAAAALLRGHRLPRGAADWAWFTWMALTGSVVPFLLTAWATQHIDSAVVGILSAAVPIAVGALAHALLPDEPMNRYVAAGLSLGFAGVIVLIGPAGLWSLAGGATELVARLAMLGATLCYALHAVTARRMPPMGITVRAAGSVLVAAVLGLGLALAVDPAGIAFADATTGSFLAAVWLGLFPTGLASLLLFRLLDQAGARFLSLSNYLMPAVAVLAGMALLGERPDWTAFAGLALILGGIAYAERGRAGRLTPPRSR